MTDRNVLVKCPPPRPLTQQETLDSLNHWKTLFRNYFRRDSIYKPFLAANFTWDPTQINHGLADVGDDTAEIRKENLEDFLYTLAGFLPHSYLTEKIVKDTKSLQQCWNIIYEHYNVQITQETFLDFETLKKDPAENYRQFYEKLLQHSRLHLAGVGAKSEHLTNTSEDSMTISLMNHVALQWLRKIDPKLVNIIRTEYSTELRRGDQLSALVPRIAPNIDSLLARHTGESVSRVKYEAHDEDSHDMAGIKAVNQFRGRGGRKEYRGRGISNYSRQNDLFCPGCFSISKELKATIDFKHKPAMCPRSVAVARYMQADQEETADEDENNVNFEDDGKEPNDKENILKVTELQNKSNVSRIPATGETLHQISQMVPNFILNINLDNGKSVTCQPGPIHETTNIPVSDTKMQHWVMQVNKLEGRKHMWKQDKIRKEQSPRVKAFMNDIKIHPVIDEGSELNCLSESFAIKNKILFTPTECSASSADSTGMKVMGQTVKDMVISPLHTNTVLWDLGKGLVVRNLSVDMLIGEPGKLDNQIITLPHLKQVKTKDVDGNTTFIRYWHRNRDSPRHLCKSIKTMVMLVGDKLTYKLPSHLQDQTHVAISPVRDKQPDWIMPKVLEVSEGNVVLENKTSYPVKINKDEAFADIVGMVDLDKDSDELGQINKVLDNSEDHSHLQHTKPVKVSYEYLDKVVIDPNDQLGSEWKRKFKNLCKEFADTITPYPGRYNGAYGDIDNSLDFTSTPPPSVKARLPNYSTEKLKIMANLMDELETMGVLAKPEEVGVVPAFVVPSMLQPKPEKNEWRLVSDFTPLNIHIRKLETVSPSIKDAKKILAKYRYNIECDLSHCFFQGGMKKEDIQYLATPHPYKGLRVYCVEPQGLRNASEHAYERLSRIFGDLCMEEKMTRMADGLYIVANTAQDLFNNFKTVLSRARYAGLTFKPKKIIVAPRETVLFGWRKCDEGWRPTEHTISPLKSAEEPVTTKQLRSFLGSFKQLTECVKNYAILLSPLEQAVAGKASADRVNWTEDLKKSFQAAKDALENIDTIFVARPTDKLDIYTDYSAGAKAIGGRLLITRETKEGTTEKLLGGHFSCKLNNHQKNWLPCEGEALGVRLTAKHYSPIIMENENITTIHTDNMPTVHAWKRMKTGAFSTSARVASFLTGLSALRVEVIHKSGKNMMASDYNSRHPNRCQETRCKICQFAIDLDKLGDDAVPMVCNVSVADIENGTTKMPFTQRAAWSKVQSEDKAHKMLFRLIETSGIPERKKATGDYTTLKRLHNLYRNGLLKIEHDGLVTVLDTDSKGNVSKLISVPNNFFPGLVNALHIKMNHPSRAQMQRLVTRYFYCPGHARMIDEVITFCDLCKSLKDLPKELFSESTQKNPVFGRNFSADVIKKDGQLIFICREKLSQFVSSKFIHEETADALRDAVVSAVIEFMPDEGAIIQVDCAPALQSLASESKLDGSILKKLGIIVDVGRTLNINKNPIAENCIKEFHKERLRLNVPGGKLSEINRAIITKNINSRIRERGYTAKEMAFHRDQFNNCSKHISDEKLSEDQNKKRLDKHNKVDKNRYEATNLDIGDDVYLKVDKSKNRGREKYKVTKMFERDGEQWAVLQKSNNKFMAKEYEVKISEIFPVIHRKNPIKSDHIEDHPAELIPPMTRKDEEETQTDFEEVKTENPKRRRSQRKAAAVANESFKRLNIRKTILDDSPNQQKPPLHAWNYNDWVRLDEENDMVVLLSPQVRWVDNDAQVDEHLDQAVLPSPPDDTHSLLDTFNLEEDHDSIPPALSKDRSLSVSVNRVVYLTQDDGEVLDIQPVCRDLNQELETSRRDEQIGLNNLDRFRGDSEQTRVLTSIKEETSDVCVGKEDEPLWDHSPQYLIGDARHNWEDSMETTEVDDEIALALIPRKLFETSDSDDSVFEGTEELNPEPRRLTKKNMASSTNNNFLEDLNDLDDENTSYEESDNREEVKSEENDGDDETDDQNTGNNPEGSMNRKSERAGRRQIDYKSFHNTGVMKTRK